MINRLKKWIEDQDNRCIEENNSKRIKFEEKNKKILFDNPDETLCYKINVDGCLIKEGCRCDNALINSYDGSTFYIELKGSSGIYHAIEQLERTTSTLIWDNKCRRTAIVVCKNRYPKTDTVIMRAMKKFNDKNITLLILNSVACFNLKTKSFKENQ